MTALLHRTRFLVLIVCITFLTAVDAKAQNAPGFKTDTLTQRVLVHPIIDTNGGNFELMSREHMYQDTRDKRDQLMPRINLLYSNTGRHAKFAE
jgi:hypothetical protein